MRDAGSISTKPKSRPQSLSPEEIRDLRMWLRYDDAAIRRDIPELVDFSLATGLRIGEVCAVRWRHVDFEEGTIQVVGNVVRLKGKGLVVQEDESSKLTPRRLALPPWAIEMLKTRKKRRKGRDDDPIFVAPLGGLRDPRNTNRDLREAVDFAGYDWVTTHTFRRTVATLLDSAGRSAREAADQLGHATPSMTMDRYFGRNVASGAAEVLESIATM